MRFSIVLCTFNRAASLERALHSLRDVVVPRNLDWELLVVDNNSTDDTGAVARRAASALRAPVRYVLEPSQGKSFALNTGIAAASGEVLVFTDDDVTFHQGWLQALVAAFEDPTCIGVAGRIVPVWSAQPPPWYSDAGPYRLMQAIVRYDVGDLAQPAPEPPYGANMAYRRDAFERYGLFDTRFGPSGRVLLRGEDTEFGRRVITAGEVVQYCPDAIVYHPVEAERLRKSYFQSFYYEYGRLQAMLEPCGPSQPAVFGVPRHLFRRALVNAARWATSSTLKTRFYFRLACYKNYGAMAEYYKRARPRV